MEQRNTPDELASPNEKLNSRRTRTVIPVKSELLEPYVIPTSSIIRASVKKKQRNKRYHNKKGKPPHPLVVGDSIRAKIRPQSSPLWTRGSVVRRKSDRSYIVRADGREYRRHRCHIRKTREMTTPKVVVTYPSLDSPVGLPTQSDAAFPTAPQPKFIELSGVNTLTKTFFRESWESHEIATEPDKKAKPVILETLQIVLGRETKFLVIDDAPSSPLSGKTCEELELLSIKRELLVDSVSDVKRLAKNAILREHNDVFTGLRYIGNYKTELTEGAVPK